MRFCALLFAVLLSSCTHLSNPIYDTDDGAINGYDPIAYIDENKAVKGSAEFASQYHEANWYFASADNKQRFDENPEAFLPQYGGYCAYGMSRGYVVSTDPDAFTVHEGKLYLNYSLSVRDTWSKDIPTYIQRANEQWLEKRASGGAVAR